MRVLAFLTFVGFSAIAFAREGEVPRLPTADELFQSFTESYASKREHAAEYMNHDAAKTAEYLKRMDVTPEETRTVANFIAKLLKREIEICEGLQAKYPKTKAVNCIEGVLMSGGLGHADDQKELMDNTQNIEFAEKVLPLIEANFKGYEGTHRLAAIKKGITAKQLKDSREVQDLEMRLGVHSSFLALQEMAQATIAGALK